MAPVTVTQFTDSYIAVEVKGWQQELLEPALLLKLSNCKISAYETPVSLRSLPTRQKETCHRIITFFLMSFSN